MWGQASRSRIAACSASANGSASVVELTSTLAPGATSRHQSQMRFANAAGSGPCPTAVTAPASRRTAPGRSRRLHLGEVFGDMGSQRLAHERSLVGGRHPVTAEQLLLAI